MREGKCCVPRSGRMLSADHALPFSDSAILKSLPCYHSSVLHSWQLAGFFPVLPEMPAAWPRQLTPFLHSLPGWDPVPHGLVITAPPRASVHIAHKGLLMLLFLQTAENSQGLLHDFWASAWLVSYVKENSKDLKELINNRAWCLTHTFLWDAF